MGARVATSPPRSPRKSPASTPTRRVNIGRADECEVEKVEAHAIAPIAPGGAAPLKSQAPAAYLAVLVALAVVFAAGASYSSDRELKEKVGLLQADVRALKDSVAQIEQALAGKPSMQQVMDRFQHPLNQLRQRAERVERSVETVASSTSAPSAAAQPVAAPQARVRKNGTVELTFVYEPQRTVLADAKATVLWLGQPTKDGNFSRGRELKYMDVPRGMRFVQTTVPGDCWRARDAASSEILLDHHCATSADEEVRIR